MWALRRASAYSIKGYGLSSMTFRASTGIGPFSSHIEDNLTNSEHRGFTLDKGITTYTYHCTAHFPNMFSAGSCSFSTRSGAKSDKEEQEDLKWDFSELDTPDASETTDTTGGGDEDSESSSESEVSNVDENMEDALENELIKGTEVDGGDKEPNKKLGASPFVKLVLSESNSSFLNALDHYVEDKDINRTEVYSATMNLRRRKMFVKALQLSEWLEKREDFDFKEQDYASRLDLLAKVRGLNEAENYISNIPKTYREELVYRTFLANCVSVNNMAKAEEIFNKMKELGFSLSPFACNQLLLLYKRTDKKKIADVLLMMEKEDVKPTLFTYQLLIDTKGLANDMDGMEQIVETMQANGISPSLRIKATIARHYANNGLKEKAEAIINDLEGDDLDYSPWVCPVLLPIYATLGRANDVERVWEVCRSKLRQADYLAAIEAWGKLKNVEQAEAVFQKMTKSFKRISSRHYNIMLKVYAQNKLLSKGKKLLKEMGDSGCEIGPIAWDCIVKLYVDAGEVEKADSVLQKAIRQNPRKRPFYTSYMHILEQYAKNGDVHNAEKIFHRLRQAGYVARAGTFHTLLRAYINAKAPAYGFRERMKADNIFPNRSLAAELVQVDAFKKTAVSELLD
ncbi:unnamed protein product [Amaranthus hypochondriacus]